MNGLNINVAGNSFIESTKTSKADIIKAGLIIGSCIFSRVEYFDCPKTREAAEISGLRAGRASINMVDNIIADAYSSKMPLNQLSNISVPEPRLITVNVWDSQLVDSVVKSISGTDLGLNPQVEGTMIRLPIPELSEERRKEMVRVVGKFAESSKVAVRNIRRDTIEIIRKNEKSGEISQDQKHMFETQIQKITDEFIVKIDDIFSKKEKDIITL